MASENSEAKTGTGSVEYPKLPPRIFASVDAPTYIAERLNGYISWADRKAIDAKTRYQVMRALSVVGGAIVPVLVNIDHLHPYVKVATTVISIVVLLMVSLESVFHYREQWVNYRATEQYVRKEYFLFTTNEGPYRDKKDKPDEAFLIFVERVEGAIEAENTSTLQVLTTVSEAPKGREPTGASS